MTQFDPEGENATADTSFDHPLLITVFGDAAASRKSDETTTLAALGARIRSTDAKAKEDLPWLKLARFGDKRSPKNSLRHDANLVAITGIEADYDGGVMPVAEVSERLLKAGILSLIYTSPSHAEDAPRWRVLCPTSSELAPSKRSQLLGRLNGVLGGVISRESWTLSQGYFFGSVRSNPSHRVELVEGWHIDTLDDLDATWWGKDKAGEDAKEFSGDTASRVPFDEEVLLREIISGNSYHVTAVRLLGRWARDGVPMMEARRRLLATMEAVPQGKRDDRWRSRYGDVDRCLEDIYVKEASARDAGKRGRSRSKDPPDNSDDTIWSDPVDFLGDSELTGPPELRPEHLPEALYYFAADTAARMGVDPSSVALGAVVACASLADETWCIQPKAFDHSWTENARIWGAIVGDPSIRKTPVISACTRPLDHLDTRARAKNAADVKAYKAAHAAWKRADDTDTPEPTTPKLDRYIVENTTVEALSDVLRDDAEAKQTAPSGKVLVRQDEMSEFFANLDRYRAGGKGGGDRGAYLRLYNGGRYVIDRVGRGSFACSNWSACFIGGIQPGPIQQIAREAVEDGLLQRFCYNVPGRQGGGEDRPPDAAAIERYHAIFPMLSGLHPPSEASVGASSATTRAQVVVLHADAHRHRISINELAEIMAAMPDTSSRLKSALGKWPGLFARLALTFHLIEIADARAQSTSVPMLTVLREATAATAAAYMRDILLPHLLRADATMFSTAQTGHARWIAGYILAQGQPRITLRDVVQAYGALRAPENRRELLEVMESLVTVGWLQPEPQPNLARSPAGWAVNPAVHTVFAARAAQERHARAHMRERMAEKAGRAGKRP